MKSLIRHCLWVSVSQTSLPALLAVTNSEREASILGKFHDQPDNVFIR